MDALIAALLDLTNEALAAAIVIVAASMLLYNLTRNRHDRVARTSAVVLGCVTATYIGDVFITLEPSASVYEATLRLQWIGIAFIPAALFHLSDALLATTGLPSRGRRRRVTRALYVVSLLFLLAAAFSDLLVQPLIYRSPFFTDRPLVSLRAGVLFPVYLAYFLIAAAIAFINVNRARARCLARSTRRRMGYLQIALLTPAVGIFPFSVVLGAGMEFSLLGLFLVNVANIIVILMLLFLAYPLSFFGSRIPDRVVKAELMRFILRGPATGVLALVVILFTAPATRILGISGDNFMPFAVVAVVLLWQWIVALAIPYLEQRLVYADDDADQTAKLSRLSERLLARGDLLQLLEALLASTVDYLRVNSAFVVTFNGGTPELVAGIGTIRPTEALLETDAASLQKQMQRPPDANDDVHVITWNTYWLVPLFGRRSATIPIGFLGIQARANEIDLTPDDDAMLKMLTRRAAHTLDDLALQGEIFAALEGLLPQINITRSSAAEIEYRPRRAPMLSASVVDPLAEIDLDQFREQVRAALKHYWGGPGLTSSRLLELEIVRAALPVNDDNAAKALRAVLQEAIERQRPEGDRSIRSPEWTLYNILDYRFLKRDKVREVAERLSFSEPDLYRKQRAAIDAVSDTLLDLERAQRSAAPAPKPAPR